MTGKYHGQKVNRCNKCGSWIYLRTKKNVPKASDTRICNREYTCNHECPNHNRLDKP